MVFDTGSHLTWTQCYQCKSCYEQANARFNPLNSSTYEASDYLDDTCKDLISSGQGPLQMSRHWHWRVVQCLAGASGGTSCTAIGASGTQPRQPHSHHN
ncbi:hypothetical protein AAZX31_11G247500 [Glycine max]